MSNRRDYDINIVINGHRIRKVVVDPHYEEKHSKNINDELILDLVKLLDGGEFDPEEIRDGYEYYATDGLELNGKSYKLVWILDGDKLFIGVVNAYRRK